MSDPNDWIDSDIDRPPVGAFVYCKQIVECPAIYMQGEVGPPAWQFDDLDGKVRGPSFKLYWKLRGADENKNPNS